MAAVTTTPRQKFGWGTANFVVDSAGADPGALAGLTVVQDDLPSVLDPTFLPEQWTWGNYSEHPEDLAVPGRC